MDYKKIGKKLCHLLRHKPDEYNCKPNIYGFVSIESVINGLNINIDDLYHIVDTDIDGRYLIDYEKLEIAALYGHSYNVVYNDKKVKIFNSKYLLHGTKSQHIDSILNTGLEPKSRAYVHITNNLKNAIRVANRRSGDSVILSIDVQSMLNDKKNLYQISDMVFLSDKIEPKYIDICDVYNFMFGDCEYHVLLNKKGDVVYFESIINNELNSIHKEIYHNVITKDYLMVFDEYQLPFVINIGGIYSEKSILGLYKKEICDDNITIYEEYKNQKDNLDFIKKI